MSTDGPDASISRRSALAGLGATGAGLAVAAMAARVSAQEATPMEMAGHPVVGTWIVTFEDPNQAPAVAVWAADGSFVDASSGHIGQWEATGPRTALHSWIHVFPEDNNYVVVSGTIEVDASGDSFTQPYSAMVVSADGTLLNTISSVVNGRRFRVVPEDQLDAPLEVMPKWAPMTATPET